MLSCLLIWSMGDEFAVRSSQFGEKNLPVPSAPLAHLNPKSKKPTLARRGV